MQTVSLTMVKNEQDIIEAFVRHNLRSIDHMFIADNLSTDGTLEILQALKAEGLPLTIDTDEDQALRQSHKMTTMYRKAFRQNDFDYVFLLDADEFLDLDREEMISLRRAHGSGTAYYVKRVNYLYGGEVVDGRETSFFELMSNRDTEPETDKSMIFHDAAKCRRFRIGNGNHHIRDWSQDDGPRVSVKPEREFALIRHFPIRSVAQYMRKGLLGWFAMQLRVPGANEPKSTVGSHWRTQYRLILEQDCNVGPEELIGNLYGDRYGARFGTRDPLTIDFELKYEHLIRQQSLTTLIARMYETTIEKMWSTVPS
ncbi:glycosyltransferase family 2 protein [Arthrobacter sp. UYCu712]|uniref:glycosyltransferase family 2 protein n=1 Tax=Arthrobacter sp. UYCu712 TaxID=3156340 RepID=UPI003398A7BC